MKLSFLGAAHEVTGSCTLLETKSHKILVDFGMEQGADIYENCEMPVSASEIDFLFLTHAHIDHSGKVPLLVKNGFTGKIYTTLATRNLCRIMLLDSAHIQEQEAVWKNRKAKRAGKEPVEPMYTAIEVEQTLEQMVPCSYNESYRISDEISVRFLDAGHLLGSASIEISVTEDGKTEKILFSGDIGNVSRPLIRDPQLPEDADYVVIESTYGDRLHGERRDYVGQLTRVLQETLDKGGTLVIPAFAVGRTQELLYLISNIKEQGLIKGHDGFPVWVDSPLSVEATRIYNGDLMDYYDDETLALLAQGVDILDFADLHLSVETAESIALNSDTTPKVIISSSGMCEAGRIRHHLKHYLWRKESTILFVGYQSPGTIGQKLQAGEKNVKLFNEDIHVNATIATMDGISGHADKDMLLGWLKNLKKTPKMVFVNHGEDAVCESFAMEVADTLGYPATAPFNGGVYDLAAGTFVTKGNTTRIQKKPSVKVQVSSAFQQLLNAGNRLMNIINKHKNGANKDLKKFANQIIDLCNRWDK